MYHESNGYVITYSPSYLEYHSDSSDFGDSDHCLYEENMESVVKNVYYSRSSENKYLGDFSQLKYLWKNETSKSIQCMCKDCVIQTDANSSTAYRKKGRKCDEMVCTNSNVQATQSKLAMMRSKILPCLSNIFCRSSTKRPENTMKDNCCQVYSVSCNHKRKRTTKKVQNFSIQSNSTDDEIDRTPVLLKPVPQKRASKNSSESCDITSSSLSLETAKTKMKKIVETELKKYYLKKQYIRRNKEQQYPSRNNVKVYSTLDTNQAKSLQSQFNNFGCDVMPSNSSVFWEYLVDKISKKYQTNNRGGVLKSCHCTNSQQCPSMAGPRGLQKDSSTQECPRQISQPCSCKNSLTAPSPASQSDPKLQKRDVARVLCKCRTHVPPTIPSMPVTNSGTPQKSTPREEEATRPCQEPHDEVKASLQEKYNGEVLCIHNPPCILINGCLNLPPVKGQFSPTAWPAVTQETSYHVESCFKNNEIVERACQYQPPSMEYLQYDMQVMAENMKEKMTQSICNHDPPCEIVRCCYKPNFDPKLDNSCVHVPMCPKIPECLLHESSKTLKSCDHQPRCPELPICKEKSGKNFSVNEIENVGAQVKPGGKAECRHERPCIMIPKCLGKMMCEGYVPYEAIPDCVHQPPCEMIPACCRKSAKMVSVYCQYPAPCRIV